MEVDEDVTIDDLKHEAIQKVVYARTHYCSTIAAYESKIQSLKVKATENIQAIPSHSSIKNIKLKSNGVDYSALQTQIQENLPKIASEVSKINEDLEEITKTTNFIGNEILQLRASNIRKVLSGNSAQMFNCIENLQYSD